MTSADLNRELASVAPLLASLAGCPQEPDWHAEGDVAVHTAMVREALEGLPEFKDLPEDQKNILRLAAATHDIGKPATTRRGDDGKLHSYGHAMVGAKLLRLHWWRTGYVLPAETRDTIAMLVRYHSRPLHPRHSFESLAVATSGLVNCHLLSLLAQADIMGRICPADERADALLKIELFREAARENGCLHQPYVWPNTHARWKFYRADPPSLHYAAYDDRRFVVHMLFGLPGAGKSFVAQSLGLPAVSRDQVREEADLDPTDKSEQGEASQLFQGALRGHLRLGAPFIIDGTNLLQSLRANTIDLCANYGAAVHMHVIDRDRKAILRQNLERDAIVPQTIIERMASRMDFPDVSEVHEVVREP